MAEMANRSSRRQQRQKAKRIGILTDAQVAMGWFVILGLVALLGAIYLNQASRIAGTGRRVQLLQNELDGLKRENADLERSIAEAQSLDRLQEEAVRLGFQRAEPEDIEFLAVSEYPAVAPPAAGETPPPPPQPVSTIGEALRLAAEGVLGDMVRGESAQPEQSGAESAR
jgi:FtsZ-binding cell division protein ZapB